MIEDSLPAGWTLLEAIDKGNDEDVDFRFQITDEALPITGDEVERILEEMPWRRPEDK